MATTGSRRMAALRVLWQTVSRSRKAGSPGIGDLAEALPRMVGTTLTGRYRLLGKGTLGLMVLAIAYLVSPVDLVPEMLLGPIGLVDDGVVAAWLAGILLAETERYVHWERAGKPQIVDAEPR